MVWCVCVCVCVCFLAGSLAAQRIPKLLAHIREVGMPLELIVTRPLLACFVTQLPTDTLCRLLDAFFLDGTAVLLATLFAVRWYDGELHDIRTVRGFVRLPSAGSTSHCVPRITLPLACFASHSL